MPGPSKVLSLLGGWRRHWTEIQGAWALDLVLSPLGFVNNFTDGETGLRDEATCLGAGVSTGALGPPPSPPLLP